jgi:hypothetical protein
VDLYIHSPILLHGARTTFFNLLPNIIRIEDDKPFQRNILFWHYERNKVGVPTLVFIYLDKARFNENAMSECALKGRRHQLSGQKSGLAR